MKERMLDPTPSRVLTSRECASAIGGLLGGLCQLSTIDDVRTAVQWWAETPEAWEMFERFKGLPK